MFIAFLVPHLTVNSFGFKSGMRAEVLQKLLGHQNISTTINTYTTIFDQFKNEQVEESTKSITKLLNL